MALGQMDEIAVVPAVMTSTPAAVGRTPLVSRVAVRVPRSGGSYRPYGPTSMPYGSASLSRPASVPRLPAPYRPTAPKVSYGPRVAGSKDDVRAVPQGPRSPTVLQTNIVRAPTAPGKTDAVYYASMDQGQMPEQPAAPGQASAGGGRGGSGDLPYLDPEQPPDRGMLPPDLPIPMGPPMPPGDVPMPMSSGMKLALVGAGVAAVGGLLYLAGRRK